MLRCEIWKHSNKICNKIMEKATAAAAAGQTEATEGSVS